MSEMKLTNADRYGRDGARALGLEPDMQWAGDVTFPQKIQVGYQYSSPSNYEIYTDEGNFVGKNDDECRAFAVALQIRYNVHAKLLEALKEVVDVFDDWAATEEFVSVKNALNLSKAAIKSAEGE